MNEYIVTAVAGKEVAGKRSPGLGKAIQLTDEQAAHPLRLGYIRRPDEIDGRKGGSKPRSGKKG